MGGGAILGGLMLGAIGRVRHRRASSSRPPRSRSAGAVLTFFGFMHGEAIGFGQTPLVALSYLIVAGLLLGCARTANAAKPAAAPGHAVPVQGAAD